VGANPDDSTAYLLLGEAYLRLARSTRERQWFGDFQDLYRLRLVQTITAFHAALRLNPDSNEAHTRLFQVYWQEGYPDQALVHFKEHLRLARAAGRQRGETQQDFQKRLGELEGEVNQFEVEVERNQAHVEELYKGTVSVLERARVAQRFRLPGLALKQLLASDYGAFGAAGVRLELSLMLTAGRAHEVLAWTDDDKEILVLGPENYFWLRAQAAAALGKYAQARKNLSRLLPPSGDLSTQQVPSPQQVMARVVAQTLLTSAPGPRLPWVLIGVGKERRVMPVEAAFFLQLRLLTDDARRLSDLHTLLGLLALEAGDTPEAAREFAPALTIWPDDAADRSSSRIDFGGRRAARYFTERLRAAR
jgi:tetratricopeptide (TPR) repeat protein